MSDCFYHRHVKMYWQDRFLLKSKGINPYLFYIGEFEGVTVTASGLPINCLIHEALYVCLGCTPHQYPIRNTDTCPLRCSDIFNGKG